MLLKNSTAQESKFIAENTSHRKAMWTHSGSPEHIKSVARSAREKVFITENFYSSVALSLKLLSMGLYHVGTVRNNRLGWCKEVQNTQKRRPKNVKRGTYRIAQAKDYPQLVALSWLDSRPVNMLATGCSTVPTTILRREKDGSRSVVPCPSILTEYLDGMGGVDVHDPIRLQRYSIQKTVALRKYYKQLFLGLVDTAITNEFIIYKLNQQQNQQKVATHAKYMRQLHKALLGLQSGDFEANMLGENLASSPIPMNPHKIEQIAEKYSSQNKRRPFLCKVCSLMSDGKSSEATYICRACTAHFNGRVVLCNSVRRIDFGNTLTCAQIWHDTWKNGTMLPQELKNASLPKGKA